MFISDAGPAAGFLTWCRNWCSSLAISPTTRGVINDCHALAENLGMVRWSLGRFATMLHSASGKMAGGAGSLEA
jgi:hypothetical protein